VKIVLTQGDKEVVSGTDNYDSAKTSVLSKGQTLYINSTESGMVTLNITVKDLQRVEAYGQSVVVTSNNFDVKNLQLFLNQSATAKIKTTAQSLYTIVKDDAVLKLNGTAGQSTMVATNMKNVKMADFASLRSESYASEAIMAAEGTTSRLSK
jgi:UDP-N-acetylmuramate-alanine ligase